MTVIVDRTGFHAPDSVTYLPHDPVPAGTGLAIELPNDADADSLAPYLDAIARVRIPFPKFGDGRGFSLARQLREMGYRGHLRASGYLISDQFRHAVQSGFDDVEIPSEIAARQPEAQWTFADPPSYRRKLAGDPVTA